MLSPDAPIVPQESIIAKMANHNLKEAKEIKREHNFLVVDRSLRPQGFHYEHSL